MFVYKHLMHMLHGGNACFLAICVTKHAYPNIREEHLQSCAIHLCVICIFLYWSQESYSFKVDFQPTVQATDHLKYLKCRSSTESLATADTL